MIVEDFIGIEENAFTSEYCEDVIQSFNEFEEQGLAYSRQQAENGISPLLKKDKSIDTTLVFSHSSLATKSLKNNLGQVFLDIFWEKYNGYCSQIPGMASIKEDVYIWTNKCQKTEVGGGYHIWHNENSSRMNNNRLASYILYLNDVEKGGETEFLHQHKRYKPKQGTLVIFPAGFTHTHRGNPPLSNTKYIITGWVEI